MASIPCAGPMACHAGETARAPIVPGTAARDELKTFLRLDGGAEDDAIDRLLAAAIGHGEAFTGRTLLVRAVTDMLAADGAWRRLGAAPVRAITAVTAADGGPLAAGTDAMDIDAGGDGWVRAAGPGVRTVRVVYQAGVAAEWAGLPEPLRQGVVRLAAHLFTHRDAADEGAPPAAVAALWRPWRRMRLL